MTQRFDPIPYDVIQVDKSRNIIDNTHKLEEAIFYIADGREKSIALTKLEEVVMWANRAIAVEGLR